MHGYIGKILRVDLSTEKLWDEPLNEEYVRAFVGGSGLAARYVYDMVDGDTDPLGPDNPLVFMTAAVKLFCWSLKTPQSQSGDSYPWKMIHPMGIRYHAILQQRLLQSLIHLFGTTPAF